MKSFSDDYCVKKQPAKEGARPSHTVRRVILRQIAILNYINPF
jgi:hypothetical protein